MLKTHRNWLNARLRAFAADESAITSLEYGLVVMVVSSIVFIFVQDIGSQRLWEVLQGIATGYSTLVEQNTDG